MVSNERRTPFGARMLQARTASGLTQKQVCAQLGISQGTLAQLERSGSGSSLVVQFADLYKVNPRWLSSGEGEISAALPSPEALEIARAIDAIADPQDRSTVLAWCRMGVHGSVKAIQTLLTAQAQEQEGVPGAEEVAYQATRKRALAPKS